MIASTMLVARSLLSSAFRRRRFYSLLLAMFMLASSLFLFAPVARASTLVQRGYILINGNSDFTASNGVTGGTGTAANPYTISGWNMVTSSSSQICIEIENTSAYFVIQNVQDNCPNNGNAAFASVGLVLSGVSNGKVESSTLSGNSKAVVVSSSSNLVVSGNVVGGGVADAIDITSATNMTISNNQIHGNVG